LASDNKAKGNTNAKDNKVENMTIL
jgi:hypothetical protein